MRVLGLFEEDPKTKMAAEFERYGEEEGGQGPSSVATVTTPPTSPHRALLSERKRKDKCFKCGNQGHWARDCPSTTSNKKPSPPNAHLFPVLRCHCGVTCTLCVSGSDDNYGRPYYARNCNCGHAKTKRQGRNFYKWFEDVKAPLCKCGAGACTINFQEVGDGIYNKYYTCRIRTGHGSCGFLHFDSPPNSWPMEIDKRQSRWSPQLSEPPNIRSHVDECAMSGSSNRNVAVPEAEASDFAVGKVSRLRSLSDIRSRQIEFQNQISAAGNSPNGGKKFQVLMTGKGLQIMGLHVHGWVGRLAFPPPRILSDDPLQNFFRCMFPLFDPKLVSGNANISVSGSSSIIPHACSNAEVGNDSQLLAVPLGTSKRKRSFTAMQGVTNPTLKNLPKDLSLLVSVEPYDQDIISLAADNAFVSSSSPSIACEHLTKCLMKSIPRVTQMELSIQDNCNQQIPNVEKASSNYHLQSLTQVASHFKEMLHQIGKLETCILNIAEDLGKSMRTMEASYQELTKVLKLPREEVEQCTAGTGLDETCSSSSEVYGVEGRKRLKMVESLQ